MGWREVLSRRRGMPAVLCTKGGSGVEPFKINNNGKRWKMEERGQKWWKEEGGRVAIAAQP